MFGDRLLVRVFASEELCVFFLFCASVGQSGGSPRHERPIEGTKTERKSNGNRAQITKNRPKSDSTRSWGSSGRSGAIRGASGVLPGRSGRHSGRSRSSPGPPRDAPGGHRDFPERPKSAPGRPRGDFFERSFRTIVRETLPERFVDVFGSLGGSPDV